MRRAAPALLAILCVACGVSDDGALRLSWRITQGGAVSTCAAVGGVTVRVRSTRKSTGNRFEDLFRCTDAMGVSSGLRPGGYTVSVELLDKDNKTLSQPFSVDTRVTSGEDTMIGAFDFDFAGESTMSLTWAVLINEAPATCADVGGVKVYVDTTPTAGGDTVRDTYNCDAGMGMSGTFASGTYSVRVTIVDVADNPLSFVDIPVTLSGGTKNIGRVEFPFVYRRALFKAKMGTDSAGCDKVVQQEIRVSDMTHSQCFAFPIGGLTDENNQPTSGMTCTRSVCQPESAQQAIERLPPGDYAIQLFGYKGATGDRTALCYISDLLDFTVGDSDKNLGTLTAIFDTTMDPEHLCDATKPADD